MADLPALCKSFLHLFFSACRKEKAPLAEGSFSLAVPLEDNFCSWLYELGDLLDHHTDLVCGVLVKS